MKERSDIQWFEELELQADAELGTIADMSPQTAEFYAEEVLGRTDLAVLVAEYARQAEHTYRARGESAPPHVVAATAVLKPDFLDGPERIGKLEERDIESLPASAHLQPGKLLNIAPSSPQPEPRGLTGSDNVQLTSEEATVSCNRGRTHLETGDLNGALKDFSEAVRLDPQYADAYNWRGLVRYKSGDLEGALKDYSEAVRLEPGHADAFSNRGLVRYQRGDLNGALEDYSKALDLTPLHADALYNRSVLKYQQGDLNGSLQDITEILRLNSNDADTLYNLAVLKCRCGDVTGASQVLRHVLRLNPNHASALRWLNSEGDEARDTLRLA